MPRTYASLPLVKRLHHVSGAIAEAVFALQDRASMGRKIPAKAVRLADRIEREASELAEYARLAGQES